MFNNNYNLVSIYFNSSCVVFMYSKLTIYLYYMLYNMLFMIYYKMVPKYI